MRASTFEFRHRFWIISGLFSFAFFSYSFDHRNVAHATLRWLAHVSGFHLGTPLAHRVLFGAAAVLIFAAAALRTWAAAYLRSEIVHDNKLHSDRLVADGPYRHLRNPLYLGTILLAVGLGTAASVTGCVVLIVGLTLFCYRLMLREEAELAAAQSESYRRYREQVPRLVPALRPRVPDSGTPAHLAQAFRGETMMWLFGVSMVALAATLNGKLFQATVLAALVLGFVASYSARDKHEKSAAAAAK